jgi:hypothetical protein
VTTTKTVHLTDNLCDVCLFDFEDCCAKQINFGCGKGNDNVIECDSFKLFDLAQNSIEIYYE